MNLQVRKFFALAAKPACCGAPRRPRLPCSRAFPPAPHLAARCSPHISTRAQLASTEEWIDGQFSGNLGEVLIRCAGGAPALARNRPLSRRVGARCRTPRSSHTVMRGHGPPGVCAGVTTCCTCEACPKKTRRPAERLVVRGAQPTDVFRAAGWPYAERCGGLSRVPALAVYFVGHSPVQ